MAAPKLSPMMRQYMEIKEEYRDCILFFRLGDFYEMFLMMPHSLPVNLNLHLQEKTAVWKKGLRCAEFLFIQRTLT